MENKQPYIGFVWHKTPVLSQYFLKKQSNDNVPFEQMCKDTLSNFNKSYSESKKQTEEDIKYLKNLGCSKVIVVPEPVGFIKYDVFSNFLNEVPENTFVFVKSFAGFGSKPVLASCLKLALSKKVYIITEEQNALTKIPLDDISEFYSWLINQNIQTSLRRKYNDIETARNLIKSGLTVSQATKKMGISRSTFYRLISEK